MRARVPRGVTLVELVVFIVIVGVGMGALFAVYNTMTAGSADPQVRKQVLAIAESLLDEVMLMPFTYCDPNDDNAATATSATEPPTPGAQCATKAELSATAESDPSTADSLPSAESRYSLTAPFDNVNDYHRFSMSPIKDIAGDDVDGLSGYSASVTVTQQSLGPGTPSDPHDTVPAAGSLRIAVTVTGPTGVSVTLEGYRTRYSPNTLP